MRKPNQVNRFEKASILVGVFLIFTSIGGALGQNTLSAPSANAGDKVKRLVADEPQGSTIIVVNDIEVVFNYTSDISFPDCFIPIGTSLGYGGLSVRRSGGIERQVAYINTQDLFGDCLACGGEPHSVTKSVNPLDAEVFAGLHIPGTYFIRLEATAISSHFSHYHWIQTPRVQIYADGVLVVDVSYDGGEEGEVVTDQWEFTYVPQ